MRCAEVILALALAGPAFGQGVTPPPGWPGGEGGAGIPCAVRPSRVVTLAAPMDGVIARVHVRPGQSVSAGDLVAEFDTALGRAEEALAQARAADRSMLDLARTRLAGLEVKLGRLEQALETRAVSAADVDAARLERDSAKGEVARAEADLRRAVLELERARVALSRAEVRAPVDGVVAEGVIDPGEAPGPNQPIATLTVTNPLRIEAYVPAGRAPEVLAATGHEARIGGTLHPVTLDYASAMADVSSRTISIFFTLSAPGVLPGLDCVLTTPTGRESQ
ncbi:efflux RND transporter periplasmic adaptor subunit [Maritimibacter sp. DP1N21-5]|uniref:efflux RND transporter periplasmic adaptor subunit n=1 Tax=Maritimibacter sp. DP1N21-5 TaxID=2836867 RepID=UPI001C448C15|nr:efflux RND transporter periplasmic adaptor subunit [Maritimibacter sp. DP1N21-5]MBV7407464.1 efflux RND transporter periplasmic adaptor subunit [Maritimibacter sp. DP1N21-5]